MMFRGKEIYLECGHIRYIDAPSFEYIKRYPRIARWAFLCHECSVTKRIAPAVLLGLE